MPEVIIALIGIFWVGAAVAVGSAASSHGRSRFFWTLITLFTGVIGVALYLGFRRTDRQQAERERELGRRFELARRGYHDPEDDDSKVNDIVAGGKDTDSLFPSRYGTYVLRMVVVTGFLAGIFYIISGISAGPETEFVKQCSGYGIYRTCDMVEKTTSSGGVETAF